MGQLNSVAQSCLQNVLSRGRKGGELFGKKFATSFEKSAGVVYLIQKTDPKMGPLDGPNFGAAFTYLIGSGPNLPKIGSAEVVALATMCASVRLQPQGA